MPVTPAICTAREFVVCGLSGHMNSTVYLQDPKDESLRCNDRNETHMHHHRIRASRTKLVVSHALASPCWLSRAHESQ